jgi:DNA-nicking Smr family endonuclease
MATRKKQNVTQQWITDAQFKFEERESEQVYTSSVVDHEMPDSDLTSLNHKDQRRFKRGDFSIEDCLDLHGLYSSKAKAVLQEFILEAFSENKRMLLVIHGKGYASVGKPKLKPMVLTYCAHEQNILAYHPAAGKHGGSGATYIWLRNPNKI